MLGAYCDYYTSPIFAGALAAVYGLVFIIFPETPLYLLKNNEITVCIQRDWLLSIIAAVIVNDFPFAES